MNTCLRTPTRHRSRLGARLWPSIALVIIVFVTLAPITVVRAQASIDELASLEIELWPDFDRPAVLVLLTGTLADNSATPATLTIPIPDEATINAVAHVDVASGEMQNVNGVDSDTPGQITFTTPSPTFRLEYYMPYTVDGDRREFSFEWQSDLTIDQVVTTVQQPAEATDFNLTPAADQPTIGGDGLTYHPLAGLALPAGGIYSVSGSYNLAGGQLTADVLAAQQPSVEGPLPLISNGAQEGDSEFNWPLVAIVTGGLIIIAAVAWFLYANSQSGRKRPPRPKPVRQTTSRRAKPPAASSGGGVQFCHNCGQPVDSEDRFCRQCGTPVKER